MAAENLAIFGRFFCRALRPSVASLPPGEARLRRRAEAAFSTLKNRLVDADFLSDSLARD
jgi:hypothetical protein